MDSFLFHNMDMKIMSLENEKSCLGKEVEDLKDCIATLRFQIERMRSKEYCNSDVDNTLKCLANSLKKENEEMNDKLSQIKVLVDKGC